MSSYPSIIATIGLSGTVTEIETCNISLTMAIFLKDVFRPFFEGTYHVNDLDRLGLRQGSF